MLSNIAHLFQPILESIKEAVIVRDINGKIMFANRSTKDIFGYLPEELIGKDIDILIPEERLNEKKRLVETIMWGQEVDNYETERIAKDSKRKRVSLSLSALKDDNGKTIGITNVYRNITESERSGGKFQALLESAPDAMVIINKFGQIVLVNAQTEKLFGYNRENLVGQDVEMLIPNKVISGYEDQRNHFLLNLQLWELDNDLEFTGVRADKSEFPIEISVNPLEIEEGNFISAAIRDITLRKKSEDKFRALLESAPDAMVIVNDRGIIQLVNAQAEKIFEYKKNEIIGQEIEILIPDRFKGGHHKHRDGYFAAPRTRPMGAGLELFGKKKDGTEFPVEISLSPIHTEEGMLVSAAIRDITSQKRAAIELKDYADRLEISNKELAQFAYVASHDLQEPLRNITNYAILLEEIASENLNEKSKYFLGIITRSTQRMKVLISELLSFSRIGRNRTVEEVDCNIVLDGVLADMNFILEENSAKVFTEDLPVINSNEMEIKQLFQNLISNSIKFRKNNVDPVIKISCEERDAEWLFTFSDNGIGIKEDYIHKIFLIFQRLHSEEEYPGTGIGLATCKKIVELNEGNIWVESTFGEGTAFYFTIKKNELIYEKDKFDIID